MKLVIGGYAQGKLGYVLSKYHLKENQVWDGVLPDKETLQANGLLPDGQVVINHFHQWVKACMSDGGCPEEELLSFLGYCPYCMIISDEIGNGIVPMDAFERDYRERVGRMLIELAKKAEEVERVICGIGQKIK